MCALLSVAMSSLSNDPSNTTERTIEGDLFTAFVKAGAISKANANDPKKSGLVRCARTDKGVHAAGNVVSLKLQIEEPDIVEKINSHLSAQIRVWGIQRTVGSFSCYQACDSRWYEYLIPSHAFLPPHPNSFLGRKLLEVAEEMGQLDAYKERQAEVSGFWAETEEQYIKPILDGIEDEHLKELVMKALYETSDDVETQADEPESAENAESDKPKEPVVPESTDPIIAPTEHLGTTGEASAASGPVLAAGTEGNKEATPAPNDPAAESVKSQTSSPTTADTSAPTTNQPQPSSNNTTTDASTLPSTRLPAELRRQIEGTTRSLRTAYTTAKRAHRIPPSRLTRIQTALNQFLGTQNYHNYTINKSPRDPSAKRLIKSFKLDPEPKLINGTEWLSLKIHGQSFMMHQIRKMVSAVALVVRCGCAPSLLADTLSAEHSISIPKAPGLGLLLERPVFESYNANTAAKFEREALTFDKYEGAMKEFKQVEIYERIFREEEQGGAFGTFFGHVDGFREGYFLWVTAKGVKAGVKRTGKGEVEKQRKMPGKETASGANDGPIGERKKKREGTPERRVQVDSEDEEDEEEKGRADMDG